MNKTCVNKMKNLKIVKCSTPILKLANGHSLIPFGRSDVNITINGTHNIIKLFIYEGMPFDVLLGLDFCKISQINIDFKKLSSENSLFSELPFFNHQFIDTPDNSVRVCNKFNIPKFSGRFIEVMVNINIKHCDKYIFEPDYFNTCKIYSLIST